MERCPFQGNPKNRTVSLSARLNSYLKPICHIGNRKGCHIHTTEKIIIPTKYAENAQSILMDDQRYSMQMPDQQGMLASRHMQLSFTDPLQTTKYLTSSEEIVQPTDHVSQMSQTPVRPSIMSKPSVASNARPSVMSNARQSVMSSARPSVMSSARQSVASNARPSTMSNMRQMQASTSAASSRQSTFSNQPSPRMSSCTSMQQQLFQQSAGGMRGSRTSMAPSFSPRESQYQPSNAYGPRISRQPSKTSQCSAAGRSCASYQSQQLVSHPGPPQALDRQQSVPPYAQEQPVASYPSEQQNPFRPSMAPRSTFETMISNQPPMSSMRPCMEFSSGYIREQPTRDYDGCSCRTDKASFKVSPFGMEACPLNMPFNANEAICIPCGHAYPESPQDTCWRVKIMKDVGVITRGLDHGIQTQTSETRIVNADKLETLLPNTERYYEPEAGDGSVECAACKRESEEGEIKPTVVIPQKSKIGEQPPSPPVSEKVKKESEEERVKTEQLPCGKERDETAAGGAYDTCGGSGFLEDYDDYRIYRDGAGSKKRCVIM